MKYWSQKGFSIIELLISVAIIAILTGIIVSNLSGSKQKSRDAKRVSDIAHMQLALELFFDRCGRYPVVETVVVGGVNTFVPKLTDPSAQDAATRNGCPPKIQLSKFNSKIPLPTTPGDYLYVVNLTSTPTDYVLRAKLEVDGTALDDDIDTTIIYNVPNTPSSTACSDTAIAGWFFCAQPR